MSSNRWNLRLIARTACWSIGALLIASGLAARMWLPGFFRVWGRWEMMQIAEFQFFTYGGGMVLILIPLFSPDAFGDKETRRFGCLVWLVGAAVLSWLVLDSVPP